MAATLEDTLRAYRGYAPAYDLIFGAIFRDARSLAVELANDRPRQRILEIGIGTGLSMPYYRSDVQLTGIDVSAEMLEKAQRRAAGLPHSASWSLEIMNAEAMSYPDNSFDSVVALYVASTVQNLAQFGTELKRVCRPGGSIVLVNHLSSPHSRSARFERWVSRYAHRLGFESYFPIDRFIAETGLQPIETRGVGLFGYWTLVHAIKQEVFDEAIPAFIEQRF